MTTLGSTLVGLPIGFLCSLAAWWFLFHVMTPHIEFSSKIIRVNINGALRYRIKFKNSGRRNIIDVSMDIRMYVKGFYKEYLNDQKVIMLKLGISHWPILNAQQMKMTIIVSPNKDRLQSDIFPQDIPSQIGDKIQENCLGLEDLLQLSAESKFQVVAFAYDSFSGTRKAFASKEYKMGDIVNGNFCSNSLEIDDNTTEC